MARVAYKDWKPHGRAMDMIVKAREIIGELAKEGYTLTLRQLYYQFVSRGFLPNKQKEYKRLGYVLNLARLAGYIDWDTVEDRIRVLKSRSHWSDASGIIDSSRDWFAMDLWEGQKYRAEVWIEKDALAGVAERVCTKWDVPLLVCRGYTSQSAMYEAGERFKAHLDDGKGYIPRIIYLGDHDPSGIQMGEDIAKRMEMFTGIEGVVTRAALNMEQIQKYNPPPNPAKETDSRFQQYVDRFGGECWELDALHPKVIASTIEKHILKLCDVEMWNERHEEQERQRTDLTLAADRWDRCRQIVRILGSSDESIPPAPGDADDRSELKSFLRNTLSALNELDD